MADQIRELIEKINQEGVQAAEEKARQIEERSKAEAQMIVQRANSQAKKIIEEAQEKVSRMQDSAQDSLKQAGRDVLLALRSRINQILKNIVAEEVSAILSPEELAKIIEGIVKEYSARESKDVVIRLSGKDRNKLEGHLVSRLKKELKKGIELRSEEDIQGGFIISFDEGKSSFDFSDKALVEYIEKAISFKVAEFFKDNG